MSNIFDNYWSAMDLKSLGHLIRERRVALGLTQSRLAQLSELSRPTLIGLEAGTLSDLGFNRLGRVMAVLGLDFVAPSPGARQKKRGLWMAAKTASVSYGNELEPEQLGRALAYGEVPEQYMAHMTHLLDEAPTSIVVMAVEEAAEREHVSPRVVWRNVGKLARALQIHRQDVWI